MQSFNKPPQTSPEDWKKIIESKNRVDNAPEIYISLIKYQQGLEKNKSRNTVFFKQNSDSIEISHGGKTEVLKGYMKIKSVNGRSVRIIYDTDPNAMIGSYNFEKDLYQINKNYALKNPEIFIVTINHEAAHDVYYSLSEYDQKEVNNFFIQDKELKQLFQKFISALYSDNFLTPLEIQPGKKMTAGEVYLYSHFVDMNQKRLVEDGLSGLKDNRSIRCEVKGKTYDLFVGNIVSEMISYMSSSMLGKKYYEVEFEESKKKRGNIDVRLDIAKHAYFAIQDNPNLKSIFDKYQLFKNNNPDFVKAFIEGLK